MRSARFGSVVVGVVMGAVAAIAACSETPTQATDPPAARPPEASIAPVMDVAAQRLSPGVRAAMAQSLSAALAEFELEPAASMRLLHDFLDGVESQPVERLGAAAGPARTIDP